MATSVAGKDTEFTSKDVNVNEVQEIDDRIVHFMRMLHEAPEEIQVATVTFLSSIDEVKQVYVANNVKSEEAEKSCEEAARIVYLCQREYDSCLKQYLVQSGSDCQEAEEALEKSKLEMEIMKQHLETVKQELALSKETLYHVSKKAEHTFICVLRSHSDQTWLEKYVQPSVYENYDIYQQLHGRITNIDRKNGTYSEPTYDILHHETSMDVASDILTDHTDFYENPADNDTVEKVAMEAPDEIKVIETFYDYPCNVVPLCSRDSTSSKPESRKNSTYATVDKSKIYSQVKDEGLRSQEISSKSVCEKQIKKKKKKSAFDFLKSKIHGPWEGWE